jgi:catechol-2,3-dioxygenase
MLGDEDAAATLAVSDLQRARDFYENTLGLTPVQEPPGGILYKSGNSVMLVYPSEYALPDTTREGDVHIAGEFKAVWFKDPDGNILNVINETM